jgi:hypothetical protein
MMRRDIKVVWLRQFALVPVLVLLLLFGVLLPTTMAASLVREDGACPVVSMFPYTIGYVTI